MPKYAYRVAVFLLAPVILGASCLTCFLQATPVSAAVVPTQQTQDCESYQKPTKTAAALIQPGSSAMANVSHPVISAHMAHGSGCKATTDDATFEVKKQRSDKGLNASVILPVPLAQAFPQTQRSPSNRMKPPPTKDNVLTGSVIKRE